MRLNWTAPTQKLSFLDRYGLDLQVSRAGHRQILIKTAVTIFTRDMNSTMTFRVIVEHLFTVLDSFCGSTSVMQNTTARLDLCTCLGGRGS